MPRYPKDKDGNLVLSDKPENVLRRSMNANRRKLAEEALAKKTAEPTLPDPRKGEDHVVVFLREETMTVNGGRTDKTKLYRYYVDWCKKNNYSSIRAADFNRSVVKITGLATVRIRGHYSWVNIGLTTEQQGVQTFSLAESEDTDKQQILTMVSNQLGIMSEQIEIMKSLVHK